MRRSSSLMLMIGFVCPIPALPPLLPPPPVLDEDEDSLRRGLLDRFRLSPPPSLPPEFGVVGAAVVVVGCTTELADDERCSSLARVDPATLI